MSVYNLIFKLLSIMLVFVCDSCLCTVMMNFDAEWCKNHIEFQYISDMPVHTGVAFQKLRSVSDLEAHMEVAKI